MCLSDLLRDNKTLIKLRDPRATRISDLFVLFICFFFVVVVVVVQERQYQELETRLTNIAKIDDLITKLQTQKNLMGKGKRKKITTENRWGEIDESKTVYKWKKQRKR